MRAEGGAERARIGRLTGPRVGPRVGGRIAAALLAAATLVAGCTGGADDTPEPTDLTVFAAASLRTALGDAVAAYEAAQPDVRVVLATGSSATLRAQIEAGAPADVFLSADTEQPLALAGAGLADGDPVAFAANRVVVATPAADPAGIVTPADLVRDGVSIVAAAGSVPLTRYATELVEALAGQPGYPADFADRYAAAIVSEEADAAAVAVKLELAEADAAILYATDVVARPALRAVPLPAAVDVRATYAGVVLAAAADPAAARAFLGWLAGPDGSAVLARHGFLAP